MHINVVHELTRTDSVQKNKTQLHRKIEITIVN
jgi:hypothetical protein